MTKSVPVFPYDGCQFDARVLPCSVRYKGNVPGGAQCAKDEVNIYSVTLKYISILQTKKKKQKTKNKKTKTKKQEKDKKVQKEEKRRRVEKSEVYFLKNKTIIKDLK